MNEINIDEDYGKLDSIEINENKEMRISLRKWFANKNKVNKIKLICHGLGGHSHSVTIRPIIKKSIEKNYDVISIDWPFHGCSSLRFQEKPVLEDMVIVLDKVLEYIREKGYEEIHIIGHSMGSLFAIYWGMQSNSNIKNVNKITAMNPGFHKLSQLDQWICWLISKTSIQYGHSVITHTMEWTDDVNYADLRFRDPLELKYVRDAIILPLIEAKKKILNNYQDQRVDIEIIWSEEDPVIDINSVKEILKNPKYKETLKVNVPFHELCTTKIVGDNVCNTIFN